MDLRLVEYFVAIVDSGSVTRAAAALYIAQPSLSQAMKTLERELGADLFDRSGRSLTLTDTGRAFEVAARRVMADVEVARRRVLDVRDLRAGQLRLSALAEVTMHPLPELVRRFRLRHPGVQVHVLDPGHADGVAAAVRQGAVDLGLTTLPAKVDGLSVRELDPQRLVLAMTPALAADLPDPVPQSMLAGLPLIRGVDDRLVDLVAEPATMPPANEAPLRSAFHQATWELVMHGAGMAVLTEGIVRDQLDGVVARALDPPITRQVALVYRADQLSPAASAFLAVLDS